MSLHPRSYYRVIPDPKNDFSSDTVSLQVNCTGYSVYNRQDEVSANTVRQDYYLILLKEGSVSVLQPGLFRALKPGDLLIFAPGQHFIYQKELGEKMIYYWVHFTGKDAASLLAQCGLAVNTILTPSCLQSFQEQFLRLFDAFSLRDQLFDLHTSQLLSLLLISFGRALASAAPQHGRPSGPHNFTRSISYIHEQLSAPVSIQELANMEFLSISRYRELFRRQMGISPKEYVIFTKLNYACQLLKNTRMSVLEVGLAVGYEDTQYFSRLFTRHMGISPSRYRMQAEPSCNAENPFLL